MDEAGLPDVMDQLAGLPPGSPLAELRRQRPEVVRHMQGSDEAIFAPRDDGGLSRAERGLAALGVATVLRDSTLQEHYRARIGNAEAGPQAFAERRAATILAHVNRLTTDPGGAERRHIDDLLAAGLSPHAVVSLSQLIAYVNFQSRMLAGLRMLQGAR